MQWNFSFKALNFILASTDFGEAELGSKQNQLWLLGNFVDEVCDKCRNRESVNSSV
jgi:hypothetical protein